MVEDIKLTKKEKDLDIWELLLWRIYDNRRRNHAEPGDKSFFKPFTVTVPNGDFRLATCRVPKNMLYYMNECQWTYEADTTYELKKDDGAIIFDRMDFNVQPIRFDPPEIADNKIELKVTNNGAVLRDYNVYFRGFQREK